MQFFRCKHCGKIIAIVKGCKCPTMCCGEPMEELVANTEEAAHEKHIPVGTFKIIPLIETAGAIVNIKDICLASPRVVAVAFGCEDYVSDTHGKHDDVVMSRAIGLWICYKELPIPTWIEETKDTGPATVIRGDKAGITRM